MQTHSITFEVKRPDTSGVAPALCIPSYNFQYRMADRNEAHRGSSQIDGQWIEFDPVVTRPGFPNSTADRNCETTGACRWTT